MKMTQMMMVVAVVALMAPYSLGNWVLLQDFDDRSTSCDTQQDQMSETLIDVTDTCFFSATIDKFYKIDADCTGAQATITVCDDINCSQNCAASSAGPVSFGACSSTSAFFGMPPKSGTNPHYNKIIGCYLGDGVPPEWANTPAIGHYFGGSCSGKISHFVNASCFYSNAKDLPASTRCTAGALSTATCGVGCGTCQAFSRETPVCSVSSFTAPSGDSVVISTIAECTTRVIGGGSSASSLLPSPLSLRSLSTIATLSALFLPIILFYFTS